MESIAPGRPQLRGILCVNEEARMRACGNCHTDVPDGRRDCPRIASIEAFRKVVQVANEGETVGLLLAKPVPFDVLVRGVMFERA